MMISAVLFLGLLTYVEVESCGIRPRTRIVGGAPANPGDWPWQAQLIYPSGGHHCGGTLVDPNFVLTAAHCVFGRKTNTFKIRLGAHLRHGSIGTEQVYRIKKMYIHKNFHSPVRYAYDIALLKLDSPAKLNKAVNLACLPKPFKSLPAGKRCYVTGWGALRAEGGSPRALMQAVVPIVRDDVCRRSYPGRMHESMVCAGYAQGGIDACQGDSGGPLVCETNGRFYLEGAVSWGIGCAERMNYGVYADIRYLYNWVQARITYG